MLNKGFNFEYGMDNTKSCIAVTMHIVRMWFACLWFKARTCFNVMHGVARLPEL